MRVTARWSVLAAVAISSALAGTAHAIDPQRTGGYQDPYTLPAFGQPGSTVPAGRDRTLPVGTQPGGSTVPVQQILVPNPSAVGSLNPVGSSVRVVPVSATSGTQPLLAPRQPRWRLGVYSKDTETGVRIVQVVNGSAAARAGLEANDLIVAVHGYQVGFVNGELFDCATEFERWATQDGWVRMLVQNNRNGQLMTLPVQLESRLAKISGYISLNDRGSLPSDAYAVIELQEIMRPNAPPITLARQTVERPRSNPIQFEIEFDPQQIDTRRSYILTGQVRTQRETLYAPRTAVQVLAPGQPSTINIAFERVAATPLGPRGPYGQDIQLDQIAQLFQQYLNRDLNRQELVTWQSNLNRGVSLTDVQTEIFGNNQFFNQCDQNERVYIERLHELMLGRKPYPDEMQYWMSRYTDRNGIRRDIAREFLDAIASHN
ncbi:MAG: YbaY family lipoprotein [Planctomyces sp.]|nr:YbaY family lipoprotein [Planctomyces sp.]